MKHRTYFKTLFILLSFILLFPCDVFATSEDSREISIDEIREYCIQYDLSFSNNEEFLSEVSDMILERTETKSKSSSPSKTLRYIPSSLASDII